MSPSPVTVITVSFNSAVPLKAMLSTIPKGYPVVVVDNASEDNSLAVAESFGATVIANNKNSGFSRACNAGAMAADTEYLFFLNPDTEIELNTIDELYEASKKYPAASAFAPTIKDHMNLSGLKTRSILVPSDQWPFRELPEKDFETPVVSGAAIFVSKKKFEHVGGFDENIFFYYEDDDISIRLRKSFGPLMIIRSAQIIHRAGHSSPLTPEINRIKIYHGVRAKVYVTRKYGIPYNLTIRILVSMLQLLVSCVCLHAKINKYRYRTIALLSSIRDGGKYKSN